MPTPALRGISALFVYYFSNLQFNYKGSSLTDLQKIALIPGFQKRGLIDLQKNEAQETLSENPLYVSYSLIPMPNKDYTW